MSSVCDFGSGSVMAEMSALFTPPGRGGGGAELTDPLNPRVVELHPYYKRPGKGHNHDCCDACGEGGDLICCDSCPASFHFSCHAPPLEEEDIPSGDWACLRCYVKEYNRNETIKAANRSQVPSLAQEIEKEKPPEEDKNDTRDGDSEGSSGEPNRVRPARGIVVKKQAEAAVAKAQKEKKAIKLYKVKYDKYLKAKPVTNSPFDVLIAATQVANAEQFSLPSELDPLEPLPFDWKWSEERQEDLDQHPKVCFTCSKTSRNVPSIACDFCPIIYHLDCLDPPLCEIPKERWMCPNHVENFIDANLVNSTSLSERLRIWQKFAKADVDTESVRLEFFRKIRTGKLYQKANIKQRAPMEKRIKVPQFIKDQYNLPLPLYRQSKMRKMSGNADVSEVLAAPVEPEKQQQIAHDSESYEEEQTEFLSNLISMQTNFVKRQLNRKMKNQLKDTKELLPDEDKMECDENISEMDVEDEEKADKAKKSSERCPSPCSSEGTVSDCSLDWTAMDSDSEEPSFKASSDLEEKLKEYLSRVHKKQRSARNLLKISPIVKNFLALQRMNQIFPEKPSKLEEKAQLDSEVQARAALAPIDSKKLPGLMRYRTWTLGKGNADDEGHLDLSTFGHCNYVSNKHAVIYFDQLSQVYELINYSEHGTLVDNTVYALNLPVPPKKSSKTSLDNELKMSAKSFSSTSASCHCSTSMATMLNGRQGCENSAILHHGSYIRIGCLQFVFSIMEYHGGIEDLEKVIESNKKIEKAEETKEIKKEDKSEANKKKVRTEKSNTRVKNGDEKSKNGREEKTNPKSDPSPTSKETESTAAKAEEKPNLTDKEKAIDKEKIVHDPERQDTKTDKIIDEKLTPTEEETSSKVDSQSNQIVLEKPKE